MKKLILLIAFLSLTTFCFTLGIQEEYEKMEKEIMENPQVVSVSVSGMDGEFGPPYYADIVLTSDRTLHIVEFDKTLSGDWMSISKIGNFEFGGGRYIKKIPNEKGLLDSYSMYEAHADILSIMLKKEILTIDDIINNYNEIQVLAEKLSKETAEERTRRRKLGKIQDDPNFLDKFGNFENDKCWGQVFAREYSKERRRNKPGYWEGMFADE